ncbi:tyrosinase family oxidase copper chaperone [Actinoplanes sp. NPDC051346]|uniref:tyrosinase family oxidase copper chaperone n=1 Tax=Actinoplanes sp. NPDC051346 TaxID=3155048 RepID=UPI003426CD0C
MSNTNRRDLLKFAGAATVAAGTGALIVQVTTAAGSQAAVDAPRPVEDPKQLVETYRGRKIEIGGTSAAQKQAGAHHLSAAGGTVDAGIRIDGVPLHVMQNADGTYTSVSNHYESFKSLRAVARAAVDELDGARLLPLQHG